MDIPGMVLSPDSKQEREQESHGDSPAGGRDELCLVEDDESDKGGISLAPSGRGEVFKKRGRRGTSKD